MSNKTILNQKFKDLIIIQTEDGKVHELWGLVKNARDKRFIEYADQDYIQLLRQQLKSTNTNKVKEAKDALIFLNATVMADLDGNFKWLQSIGVEVSENYKKQVNDSRNSARRDFIGNNQGASEELSDFIDVNETNTISDLVDKMRLLKRSLRQRGKSIKDFRNLKRNTKNQDSSTNPQPVKTLSKEEIAELKNKLPDNTQEK